MSRFKIGILSGICLTIIGCNQHQPVVVKQPVKDTAGKITVSQTIPIWAGHIPDEGLIKGTETYNDGMVSNVSNPTITVFTPAVKNTGAAIVVFPGGGYKKLAVELEGSEICRWLASIGVTGILLKYRVPDSGPHHDDSCDCQKDPLRPMALQDAQRTVGLLRHQAAKWKIDPGKIGVMGFSAGGHLVADISTNYKKRVYAPVDEADRQSCRPDFALLFFPGHMLFHTRQPYDLNPDLPVTPQTPPTFLLQAGNDPVDTIQNSLVYYIALKKAGVPAEYHIYAEGGHAFGYRKTSQHIKNWIKLPVADWPRLVETWLHTIHMIREGEAE
ncbi:MAG TPA: alpha/beta hydrolase [Flavisolibacter sp.]|jgi:acetyl esterase/lipase|nr:alpha/beta hydrolase [Flavisolibacter sp.]